MTAVATTFARAPRAVAPPSILRYIAITDRAQSLRLTNGLSEKRPCWPGRFPRVGAEHAMPVKVARRDSFDHDSQREYSPSGPAPRTLASLGSLSQGSAMRTLKSLLCFAACWALAGVSPAAEKAIDKPEPTISPDSAAVKASNDFACALYRGLDQTHGGKNLFFS